MACNEENIVLLQIVAISEDDTKLIAKICKHLPKFGVPKWLAIQMIFICWQLLMQVRFLPNVLQIINKCANKNHCFV